MTRIDEALARARNARAEELRPAVPAAESGEGVAFPLEPGFEANDTADGGPAAEHFEAGAPVPGRGAELLEPVAELGNLAAAEKLSPTSHDPTSVEQYRKLAARLHLLQAERRTTVVMVTSAVPGEGKTLTAANLALTLSESYRRSVLLVDADLRRPWMHEIFGAPNVSGLNDALRADSDRKVPLIELTPNLTLLTSGRPESDPMSVLTSDRLKRVIEEAGARFDWVIIDTPPVGLLTDAGLLASMVDTVLLVVQAGRTPLASIKTATEAIGRDRILGVVLNRADDPVRIGHYEYYGAR